MKTQYVCEVCGYTSEDKKSVETCEGTGRRNKYSAGQRVEYRYTNTEDDHFVLKGVISEVQFKRVTHGVSYGILLDTRKVIIPELDIIKGLSPERA